jgi:hypothetical protein
MDCPVLFCDDQGVIGPEGHGQLPRVRPYVCPRQAFPEVGDIRLIAGRALVLAGWGHVHIEDDVPAGDEGVPARGNPLIGVRRPCPGRVSARRWLRISRDCHAIERNHHLPRTGACQSKSLRELCVARNQTPAVAKTTKL